MKNLLTAAATALSVLLPTLTAGSCSGKDDNSGAQQSLMEASRLELAAALDERDQLLTLMKEISASMEQIRHLENVMTLSSTRDSENPERRAHILADIAAVQQSLRLRREQLAALEEQMSQSALYTDELQSAIDALRRQIDLQASQISVLRGQLSRANEKIDSLNCEVDSLHGTVAAVSEVLGATRAESDRLENELNTCFYVAATKGELKKHRILDTGFLRSAKLLKGDFDRDFFTRADKRTLRCIALYSSKAKILSNHPPQSYSLAETDDDSLTLLITDPEAFWSLGNYLVVQTD